MGIFSDILLTVDYDRTLTAPDGSIPQRNLEAIRYFMENGGAFTVNTGRSVPMTKVFRDKVPVNAPLLLYNGSAAYDLSEKKLSFMHEIEMDMYTTVRELLETFPRLTVEIQGIDAHYKFLPNPMWDAFSASNDCAYATAEIGQDLGPFLKFTLYGEFHTEILSDMFTGTPEEIAEMDTAEAMLKEKYADKVEVFRAAARIIDVHAKGVSKTAPPGSCSSGWAESGWSAWATPIMTSPCWTARIFPTFLPTQRWQNSMKMCAAAPTEQSRM